jgi:hypothetical protein
MDLIYKQGNLRVGKYRTIQTLFASILFTVPCCISLLDKEKTAITSLILSHDIFLSYDLYN